MRGTVLKSLVGHCDVLDKGDVLVHRQWELLQAGTPTPQTSRLRAMWDGDSAKPQKVCTPSLEGRRLGANDTVLPPHAGERTGARGWCGCDGAGGPKRSGGAGQEARGAG